ncbi:MAG: sugar ABC transporter permease [Candidatus Faecousia sp.]|nr:sugar ABC transporter permease [Bacillota bacterium]MDY4755216.1 sugar ABC transporter permease [Candidatus Faecousia sp.]MDY6159604.1 sugar ABC transporter permease [Candidatus Faecousia sp.]
MKKNKSFSYAKYGYLFSIPFVVVYAIFSLYPTLNTAILGFTDAKGMTGLTQWNFLPKEKFFNNFIQLFKNPMFMMSFKNTLILWVVNFIPQILLALLLTAWFTSRRNELRAQGLFKVIFYMPNIITAASIAILFNKLFAYPVGPVNSLLQNLHIIDEPINFVNKVGTTRGIISFIQFWMWYGYTMIILISGVLGINPDLYEAAELDGASNSQMFWKITIPNLKTILLYTMITSMIGGLNMYDIPQLFNKGNPANSTLTTNMYIYNQAFSGSYMYARAAAASMVMFIIIAIASVLVFLAFNDDEGKAKREAKRAARLARKEVG